MSIISLLSPQLSTRGLELTIGSRCGVWEHWRCDQKVQVSVASLPCAHVVMGSTSYQRHGALLQLLFILDLDIWDGNVLVLAKYTEAEQWYNYRMQHQATTAFADLAEDWISIRPLLWADSTHVSNSKPFVNDASPKLLPMKLDALQSLYGHGDLGQRFPHFCEIPIGPIPS